MFSSLRCCEKAKCNVRGARGEAGEYCGCDESRGQTETEEVEELERMSGPPIDWPRIEPENIAE